MIPLPNSYNTDVLTLEQIDFVAKHLPQPGADTGRPSYSNNTLLPGILRVLRSGMRWRDLDNKSLPSGITHWRRLRFWQKNKSLGRLWGFVLKLLLKKDILNLESISIDGTVISSFAFKELTSYSGKYHKTGTKVSLTVDGNGVPLSKEIATGSAHDSPLAIPTIQKINSEILLNTKLFLADKGYDTSSIRSYLRKLEIETDIPQRELPLTWKEKLKLGEDYLKARRDQKSNSKRFVVERTNAWTKGYRRLRFRFDYTVLSFSAFLNLAFLVFVIRKLI